IGGIRRVPAGVTHGRGDHAGYLPEFALRAPETAESEHRLLEPIGGGLFDLAAVDEVFAGQWQGRVATGQCLVGLWKGGLLRQEGHGNLRVIVSPESGDAGLASQSILQT